MAAQKVGTKEEWVAARQANQVWIRRHDEYEHEEA